MTLAATTTSGPDPAPPHRGRRFRRLVDSLVCLALAVIVFRTFEVEGYMISTGSMAPTLLGFHKQVMCPSCRFEFAVGVAYDDEGEPAEAGSAGDDRGFAVCPNCGQGQIDVSDVPRNQGDQLLVHKNAFQFYAPRRWEVVVFRNPYKPTQAYVKRIAGLPFETIEIRGGDLYADGVIQRKDLTSQRAVRMNVYDHDCVPRDARWQPRWVPQAEGDTGWQADGAAFVLHEAARSSVLQPDEVLWVTYRHWIRSGGTHATSLAVPDLAQKLDQSTALLPLHYDPDLERLSCVGVLHDGTRDQLLAVADDPELRAAIQQLAADSHVAPVTDDYGYNRTRNGVPAAPVRDLMLSLEVTIASGDGRFVVEMTDGEHRYALTLHAGSGRATLSVDGAIEPVREASLGRSLADRTALVEMSLFDRQVLVAVDGQPVFSPWPMPDDRRSAKEQQRAPRQPVRFGAAGLDVQASALRLYRDVYYTPKGDPTPVQLGEDEYFVLGDNSPVSLDSRRWDQPAVPRRLFLGKPFIVHLPSKQMVVQIGESRRHIRVPDLSRIRYIR
jgi:signal peptidase I